MVRLVIVGGFFTALTLALLPPDDSGLPEISSHMAPDHLVLELSKARSEAGTNTVTEIPWASINGVLAERIKNSTIDGLQLIPIRLAACHITPSGENSCDLVMERKFFDHSVFSMVHVSIVPSSDGYRIEADSGAMGRLPLPGAVVLALTPALKQLIEPFATELDLLRSSKSIVVSSESLAVSY